MPTKTKEPLTESQKLMRAHQKQSAKNIHALADGEKFIFFTPAFEARDPNPSKDYGIGGVHLTFAERRGDLTIDCSFFTDWHLPEVQERLSTKLDRYFNPKPMCNGIYWHRPKRTNEYQADTKDCILSGGQCFGEVGSALYGDVITKRLLLEGSEGVWNEIDKAFKEVQ